MKILGIGVDIIKNERIRILINNKTFIKRTFGKNELKFSKKTLNKTNYFAKRFAAKEALFKALGIHNKLSFLDVEIRNNISGLPNFQIKGNSLKNLKKIFKNRKFKIHLSLSDDEPWAVASVIIFIYK